MTVVQIFESHNWKDLHWRKDKPVKPSKPTLTPAVESRTPSTDLATLNGAKPLTASPAADLRMLRGY